MPDMKDAFNQAGFKNSPNEKKCESCGRPFQPREAYHKQCVDCFKNSPASKPEATGAKSALQKAGTVSRSPEGKPTFFEPGYPSYFDADGLLKPEFVTDLAEKVAETLGNLTPKMTMHQLRAFYSHVKLQEGALKNDRPFKEVQLEIAKLRPFASERASKGKVPRYFEEFIARNVKEVMKGGSDQGKEIFVNGFVEHFQAVVAYCAGTLERRRQ